MNNFISRMALIVLAGVTLSVPARAQAVFQSTEVLADLPLTTDQSSAFWRDSHPVFADKDVQGRGVSAGRMEVRSRWSKDYLYFLFACPYKDLYGKPSPDPKKETYGLWNWDVAELFIGSDFNDIQRYKEFEVSPQGEWVDLDVNLHNPHHEEGWVWNSGFEHAVRIDGDNHIWYAAMKISMNAIASRSVAAGQAFRVNLFLSQGPPDSRRELAWQAPMRDTFHVPERFGLLKLVP